MEIEINNVINISVSDQGLGASEYNTSNLALFTREVQALIPVSGYEVFKKSSEIATKFGTASLTSKIANAVFSQKKNILSGSGYLAVIPFIAPTQTLTLSDIVDAGGFDLTYDGGAPVSFLLADIASASAFQAKIRTIVGLENVIVTMSVDGLVFTVSFEGFMSVPALLSVSNVTLVNALLAPITLTPAQVLGLETLEEAIVRTKDIVEYFGIIATDLVKSAELSSLATYIQTLKKMYFPVSILKADIALSGIFHNVAVASLDQTRCLYFGSTSDLALIMAGAYASRALSTNFNGVKTTQTMHLKDLVGVLPDTTISQADIETCKTSGVDLYVSIQGVPKVYSSGGNKFLDRIYNKLWFIGRLEIDGFNILARTSTKIAQTEEGVDSLVGAYRKVCEQAIVNEFIARGTWTSPDTFGVLEDFQSNIEERGYYIYSTPLSLQSPSSREARQAPIAQIAIKEAGAIHSADLIININA